MEEQEKMRGKNRAILSVQRVRAFFSFLLPRNRRKSCAFIALQDYYQWKYRPTSRGFRTVYHNLLVGRSKG